ncbi:MAG TPA: UDP-N-acetylmuramate dehydrogenase [Propionibacteriaceae bacterium]|nr:UDP-N-acetylmuramate dehydrogenase [Propionibacteriaceae bacterium]
MIEQRAGVELAALTTFRVGGPARRLIVATTESELVSAVCDLDHAGEPLLILGGGSNVLISDAGFDGSVVLVRTRGLKAEVSACSGAVVRVAAGEGWEALVARTVAEEWSGLEALSGIPGSTGASPIQNIGAYGADVSQTIASVATWDRGTGQRATFAAADCGFGYRTSRFKTEPGRYVVLSVDFQLRLGSLSAPVRYAELARALGVKVGARVPAAEVRQAVLELRRRKGMVLDDADRDTWSAGSFFTNPLLTSGQADLLPPAAPRWEQPDGRVKTSAAWLIEHAGFGKGFGDGAATLSTKHTLALTNRGSARATDLLALARQVRDGVESAVGITLVPEPLLVNCTL